MKAIFALFFIVAFIGMAMAKHHHYKVHHNGGQETQPQHGGTIFNKAAEGLNDVGSVIGHGLGDLGGIIGEGINEIGSFFLG